MNPKHSLDLLLVNAPSRPRVYQVLAAELAACEPPIWAAMIANFARAQGLSVDLLDAEALGLTFDQTVKEIADRRPLLTAFTVYGQQPSASTQCLPAASEICRMLKSGYPELKTLFLGTHMSALPEQTLREEAVDFVCQGEGPYTILNLIKALKASASDLSDVKGLWHDINGQPTGNPPHEKIANLDLELPGMAWDLLPMERYKAHNWHCWEHIDARQPYASLYTSLGCPFKCSFCCINAPFGGSGIRYFSPEHIIKEIDILVTRYGVKNLKIADEMFVLNQKHIMTLCDLIIERGYKLNIWAYARVDTVKDSYLEKFKRAGINWLALGIESGSKFVRDGVDKGRFADTDIESIVKKIQSHGIYVCGNYIFGLPDDTHQSMQETLDMALSLNCEYANFYSAMAYPGSSLHVMAKQKGLPLPEDRGGPGWIGYSQYAYETLNLPTEHISAAEVLAFRDKAFDTYFAAPAYLAMIKKKFGAESLRHIEEMTKIHLPRKALE